MISITLISSILLSDKSNTHNDGHVWTARISSHVFNQFLDTIKVLSCLSVDKCDNVLIELWLTFNVSSSVNASIPAIEVRKFSCKYNIRNFVHRSNPSIVVNPFASKYTHRKSVNSSKFWMRLKPSITTVQKQPINRRFGRSVNRKNANLYDWDKVYHSIRVWNTNHIFWLNHWSLSLSFRPLWRPNLRIHIQFQNRYARFQKRKLCQLCTHHDHDICQATVGRYNGEHRTSND